MKNKTICFYDFEATGVARDADPISIGLVAVTEKFTEVKPLTKNIIEQVFINAKKAQDDYLKGAIFGKGISKMIEDVYKPEVKTFYAEFTDFNIDKCDDWVKENIVSKLQLEGSKINIDNNVVKGDTANIKNHLTAWLSQFEEIEFWADFDVIDKPMLIDLIAEWNLQPYEGQLFEKGKLKDSYFNPNVMFKVGLPKHLPNIKYDQFFDLHTLFKIKGIDTDISRIEFIGDLIKEIPEGQSHNALYDSYVNWQVYNKLIR